MAPESASVDDPDPRAAPRGDVRVPRTARRGPMTPSERRIVAAWAAAPIVAAALVLSPFVVWGQATPGELAAAALVYGGLLGLATGFVAADRMQARQCPRCTDRERVDGVACATCGYDLAGRPRYRCEEGHEVVLDPGTCSCGRRLLQRDPPRGVGPEVKAVLRAGGWFAVFIFGVAILLWRIEQLTP